ncbi:hypothetical protein ABEW05_002415 [Botrytis cinerea]
MHVFAIIYYIFLFNNLYSLYLNIFKILTVIGTTGAQGGFVVASVLKSGYYKVRGVTRNVESVAAKAFIAKGVEMVTADINDVVSLIKVFEGSYTIFVVTDFQIPFTIKDIKKIVIIEFIQGINCANAVSKITTFEHYIWSTLPDTQKISNGKFSVFHFESKLIVDKYIRQNKVLLAKTTFLYISFYATNFLMPIITPTLLKTIGKHVQLLPIPEDIPIIIFGATMINIGIYVFAILQQPQFILSGRIVFAEIETFIFWDCVQKKSWIAEDTVIKKEDLGLTDLVGIKEVFAGIDWTTV